MLSYMFYWILKKIKIKTADKKSILALKTTLKNEIWKKLSGYSSLIKLSKAISLK